MSEKKVFNTLKAPVPKGPYSQAVIYDGLLYISGQGPIDPKSGNLMKGSIEDETRITLENIKAIVEDAGAKMKDVLKVTCYLSDMSEFAGFNEVYKDFFPDKPPARTTIQAAKLPMDIKIEIDAIVAMLS
jgi:2-iminobutanoate/2-iminopropanoate deaminase